MSEQTLSTFHISFLDPLVSSEDFLDELEKLAYRAFRLVEQYHASIGDMSTYGIMEHRFATVLYPSAVEDGDTEFSLVKAILHQNLPSRPAQVVVDFQTRTAVYENQEANLAINPEQIDRVQEEVKVHMRGVWQKNRAARLEAQRESHDWTNFLQRLESRGILPAKSGLDSYPSSFKPCPLCDKSTTRCKLCRTIMCLNRECAVSRLIPFQSCSQHISTAACHPCLESLENETSFAQCLRCELWFCSSDLTWCLGRPKDFSNRPPDSNPHDIPNSGREHPAKPICLMCVGVQAPGRVARCANIDCWSTSRGIYTRICDSCLPGGLWCACERYWICGACRTSPLDNRFKDCPQCGRTFCPDACKYNGFCANCGRTTLCNDCFEEDWSRFAGPDAVGERVILPGNCAEFDCWKRICRECLEGARCVGCGRTVCTSCTPQTNGDRNDGHRCFLCTPGIPSIFPAIALY